MSRHAFADVLKEARIARGLSLRAFASEIGYSAPYIHDVESGRRNPLSDDVLPKVAEVLRISLTDLRRAAATSRHGGFLLPLASERHDNVAAILARRWKKLEPEQLEAVLEAIS